MAHKTLIGGTAYEISGGKTLIGGTAYTIKGGKTMVDGTVRNISFGTQIGTLAVGSSVFMNVSGSRKEFLVVHQGRPSSVYDSSCDGTWLLMKDAYEKRTLDSADNDYANSDIHSYLNNTFVNLFDSDIKGVIKQVKLPYTKGKGKGGSLATGSNGISAKIFLLSYTEVGSSGNSSVNIEGAALDYFEGAGKSVRVAYLNGSAIIWWLRSPRNNNTTSFFVVVSTGSDGVSLFNDPQCVRPALILPSDAQIDENFNVIV